MRPPRDRLERDEEGELVADAIAAGWRSYKLAFLDVNGAPDRLFGHKITKRRVLLEVKKNGEEPTRQQLIRHEELREIGFEVHWVDNVADGRRVLAI